LEVCDSIIKSPRVLDPDHPYWCDRDRVIDRSIHSSSPGCERRSGDRSIDGTMDDAMTRSIDASID